MKGSPEIALNHKRN